MRVAKTLRAVLAILFVTAGIMAAVKVSMRGKLTPDCLVVLVEFCKPECWREEPFSSFPLKCDRASDAVTMALANLGSLIFALMLATCVWWCGSRFLCPSARPMSSAATATVAEERGQPLVNYSLRASAPASGRATLKKTGYQRFSDESD